MYQEFKCKSRRVCTKKLAPRKERTLQKMALPHAECMRNKKIDVTILELYEDEE